MMGVHHHAFVQGKGKNSKPTVPAAPPMMGTADMCFLYQTPAIIEYAFPIANAAKIDRHIVATINLRRTMGRILRPINRLPKKTLDPSQAKFDQAWILDCCSGYQVVLA